MNTTRNQDVLAEVVALVLAADATEFEVEYKDGVEQVIAIKGAMGVGVAALPSSSEEAEELRRRLYAVKEKRQGRVTCDGVAYALQVKVYDSFGEDTFRGTLTKV